MLTNFTNTVGLKIGGQLYFTAERMHRTYRGLRDGLFKQHTSKHT